MPFALANLIVACPLRAQTVFSAGTELYEMISDDSASAAPRRAVSGGGQAAIIMVRGDLAALWVEVDASSRPRIALGVSPVGLDLEEYSTVRKCRIVGLFASAARKQGMSLFDRTLALLTPARLRRLRRARDPETVRLILRDSPRGRGGS
jgi:hypothetical protein